MNPECLELVQLSGRNRAESPGKHHRIDSWDLQGICSAAPAVPWAALEELQGDW